MLPLRSVRLHPDPIGLSQTYRVEYERMRRAFLAAASRENVRLSPQLVFIPSLTAARRSPTLGLALHGAPSASYFFPKVTGAECLIGSKRRRQLLLAEIRTFEFIRELYIRMEVTTGRVPHERGSTCFSIARQSGDGSDCIAESLKRRSTLVPVGIYIVFTNSR
jgi:hypothetical protein